ncbi:MAG: hypothetical protein R2727_06745 [Bacteroidales bacterium]
MAKDENRGDMAEFQGRVHSHAGADRAEVYKTAGHLYLRGEDG